jgi:NAD(P)H dehydrogenase (quinone)
VTKVAIVYHSATGRTQSLAQAVARGAESVEGTAVHLMTSEEAQRAQAVLAASDAIIFGCPTYMGSASAAFKEFMDSTSVVWGLQGWRDKLAAGFTHSAALSGDKLGTLMQLTVFAAQHGMVWVGLGLPPTYAGLETSADDTNRLGSHLGAMAQSRPGGGVVPESDLRTAEHLGRRVAEAAQRWTTSGPPSERGVTARHPTSRGWSFPDPERPKLAGGIERINLREIVARMDRFEHHLIVCAMIGTVQLEVVTASEPLAFAHVNVSDEYAMALPSGDDLVDRFPLRTFLSDPKTGADVGRYNHRVFDLVLHPEKLMHWPGRLRPPFDPFEFPPGMRRTGVSLVYCASEPTPPTWCPIPIPQDRLDDAKAYITPPPPMVLASARTALGVIAKIGKTSLSLVEVPKKIAPAHGGFVVILEAEASSQHFACDLLRIPKGSSLDGTGIVRALVFASEEKPPDAVPPSWTTNQVPTFAPFEDGPRVPLPAEHEGLRIEEVNAKLVDITITSGDKSLRAEETPRYWLARLLFRVGLHRLRLGYVETYGGFFIDDRGKGPVRFGLRTEDDNVSIEVARNDALVLVEALYRAIAPTGYRERPP